jgi:hypothetical protein
MDFDFLDQGEMGVIDASQGQTSLGKDNNDAPSVVAAKSCLQPSLLTPNGTDIQRQLAGRPVNQIQLVASSKLCTQCWMTPNH